MHSKIITGIAAVAALLVSCLGNAVSAGKGENNGKAVTQTATVGDTDSQASAVSEVPRNQQGNPAVSFSSRFYTADVVWQDGGVYFPNVHIVKGSGSFPLADGSAWSSPERKAGIFFMESIPGIGLNAIKCNYPSDTANGQEGRSMQWDDMYGYRSFRMRMDDGTITVEGYDPKTGEPVNNWFLSLIAAKEKSYDLPFTVIVPQRINAMSGRTEYHTDIARGAVALNSEDTPPAFNIYPDNGTIVLKFDQQP